jgi:hypothetical protein
MFIVKFVSCEEIATAPLEHAVYDPTGMIFEERL